MIGASLSLVWLTTGTKKRRENTTTYTGFAAGRCSIGGGVNPIEWVLPPVAILHTIVDQAASASGNPIPGVPGSQTAAAKQAEDDAAAQQHAQQDTANQQAKQAADDLAARTETPQEALLSRRRAQVSATQTLGGQRRASQTLTDPGRTLSGSYV